MSAITAFGTYVPEKEIFNDYFETIVDTKDEWIVSRTGIRKRHYAEEEEYSADLCVKAVMDLKKRSNANLQDIDFILVCTTTPDHSIPNTASCVQKRLGIPNAGCNDLSGACAGFVYGLQTAHAYVHSKMYKKVLVIGAETLSKITDFTDRTSCILFGDGAGAVIVEPSKEECFLGFTSGTNGDYGHDLYMSTKKEIINGVKINPNGKILQNGKSVFKWVVRNIPPHIKSLVDSVGMTLQDIDYIIPHSANLRIVEAIAKELDYPLERMPESISEYGNTSTASIPLALNKSIENGGVKKGDLLLLIGFGGGLTFAGCVLKWDL